MSSAAQDEVDALFARNQARTRTHPEDAHHDSDRSNSISGSSTVSSSHESNEGEKPRKASMPSAVYHIPSTTLFDANTGPKGVIADAKSFDRARKRSFRQTLHALSGTVFGEKTKTPSPTRARGSESPDLSQSDDDDEFMRAWRLSRMNEMQSGGQDHRTRRLSPSKRRYGSVVGVDCLGYLDAVERVAAETIVVVYIGDEDVCIPSVSPLCIHHPNSTTIQFDNHHTDIPPLVQHQRRL